MQLIKLPAVLKKIPVSKTTWYSLVKSGDAPAPIKLGARSVAWSEQQIDEWIKQRQNNASNTIILQS